MIEQYTGTKLEEHFTRIKQDDSKSPSWLEERTFLLAPTGSFANGTNIETSDKDYKGICIPPIEYYLGLESFNEYNTSGGKNFKSTKDDIDINIIHINKFVKDAMMGEPTNIDILYVKPEDYVKMTDIGEELIENRDLFMSKGIYKKFRGSAISQKHKMIIKKSNGTGRQELVEEHGFDTKFLMNIIRLQTSGIEILETGTYSTFRPNRDLLLDCRNGKYSWEEALEMVDIYEKKLEEAFDKCTVLPATPDYNKINKLLVHLNQKALQL